MSEKKAVLNIAADSPDMANNNSFLQEEDRNDTRLEGVAPMICRYFKVANRDMVFLKFILEAYEGMNVMSTVDNKAGIIRIAIMPGFVDDMDALMADLGKQVALEPTEWCDDVCTF